MKQLFFKLFITGILTLSALFAFPQQRTITGKVSSTNGEPLPGVNIVVKGTTTGTVSQYDGSYTLTAELSAESVLLYSFMGFHPQEIEVKNQNTIDVLLEEDFQQLQEVVAIGYGTIKKRDITGSVGSVGSESLSERGSTSLMEAMQGQMAGVQITSNTGRIGGGFDINIRGVNTLEDDKKSPLFIVDGVPTDNIDFLNPQDIDRIDILKDASSTAIYGSRGTNGVVIVTTKSGGEVSGVSTVTYNGYYGVKTPARLPQMMSGDRWWEYHQDAYLATSKWVDGDVDMASFESGVSGKGTNDLLYERAAKGEYYDWYDLVLKNGTQQNHHVTVTGAANRLSYVMGFGYQAEEGNIDKESIDKYTFKTGVNHQMNEQFSIGGNVNLSLSLEERGSSIAMQEAFRLNPLLSPYDEDGNLYPQPGKFYNKEGKMLTNKTSTYNPLLEIANSSDEHRNYSLVGNFYAQYQPLPYLSLKTTLAYGAFNNRRGRSWGALTNTGATNNNLPSAILDKSESFNYTWDNQINYDRTFGEHNINLLGLYSVFSDRYESSFIDVKNLPFESEIYNLGSAGTINNVGSSFAAHTMLSYVIRANYAFSDKYLLTLSNRWDGSSKLSEGNKWKSFPSGALAWRISEEAFMTDVEAVSNMKLRVSYGFTGNNAVDPYQTQKFADKLMYYDFFGVGANGFSLNQVANDLLTWERTRELNAGIDFGFFKNRLSGSIDVYDKLSKELLMTQKLPYEAGWNSLTANVGSVSNKGLELALNAVIIDSRSLKWRTALTFAKNNNKIVEIYGGTDDDIGNQWFIGEPVEVIYNYEFDGIWQADETAEAAEYGQTEGQAKVKDFGEKGITPEEDRIVQGSPFPTWSGSLNSTLEVGNFDFSFSLFTNQGVLVNSGFHSNFADVRDRGRQKLDIDSWYVPQNSATSPNGPKVSNTYPQPRNEGTYWRNDGIGYIKDASFVKVKNITLGYSFDQGMLQSANIKQCRIYINVLNPLVFTSYEGWDPEWAGASLSNGGVSSITYQFGVNLTF